MASVRLKLVPMLTPSVRCVLDSPSITPTLPDMLTMLVLYMLVMLDILAMLVSDTLVLAILVPTMVKL